MRDSKVQKMVIVAMLSGISYVLMLFDFPILPSPVFSFLKLDFSDIPVFIGMFLYGPIAGIAVALLKCVLHLFTKNPTLLGFIGAFANFLASVVYSLPVYYAFRQQRKGKKRNYISRTIGIVVGTVFLTLAMALMNYFILLPAYSAIAGLEFGMTTSSIILYGIVPFNVIKGVIVGIAFVVIYAKLLPWLKPKLNSTNKKII